MQYFSVQFMELEFRLLFRLPQGVQVYPKAAPLQGVCVTNNLSLHLPQIFHLPACGEVGVVVVGEWTIAAGGTVPWARHVRTLR